MRDVRERWPQLAAKIRAWRDLREAAALLRAGAEAYGVDELEGLLAIRQGAGVASVDDRKPFRPGRVSGDSGKLRSPSGPTGMAMTAQGDPRAIFKRAIEHGNETVAEVTARELGRITLDESLALTALVAQKDPGRRSRYTVRWLIRLLDEDQDLTIEEAALAASALSGLGGRGHQEAFLRLSALAERATSRQRREHRLAS